MSEDIPDISRIPEVTSAIIPVANKYSQYALYLFYSDKTQSDPVGYPNITF